VVLHNLDVNQWRALPSVTHCQSNELPLRRHLSGIGCTKSVWSGGHTLSDNRLDNFAILYRRTHHSVSTSKKQWTRIQRISNENSDGTRRQQQYTRVLRFAYLVIVRSSIAHRTGFEVSLKGAWAIIADEIDVVDELENNKGLQGKWWDIYSLEQFAR